MASGTPELERPSLATSTARLEVTREDIHFRSVDQGRVRITVTVHNRGGSWSAATMMRIEAAPFGAFVRPRPLAVLRVPAIPPLRCVNVRTEVAETPIETLSHALTRGAAPRIGAGSDDGGLWDDRRDFLLAQRALRRATLNRSDDLRLPADILKLGGHGSLQWAGTLGVFVDKSEVERHQAKQLRIAPGLINSSWCAIGNGTRDKYRVTVEAEPDWEHELWGFIEGDWIDDSQSAAVLLVKPPVEARHGRFALHVEQASSGKTAIVEFEFDADAAGPGCPTL